LFLFQFSVALCTLNQDGAFAQDNPLLDTPVSLSDQGPIGTNTINVITTPDGFDNFNLGTTNAEPHAVSNPLNPLWFFAAYNPTGSFQSWHTEDGMNWAINNPAWPGNSGDPVAAYDSLGNLYYEVMKSPITGTWVAKSTNNGQTWGTAVSAATGNDKNWIACDQTMGPFANYIYTTMTNSGVGNFSRSTDGGASFATTFAPATQSLPGMMVAVGPNVEGSNNISGGCVYVVTHSGTNAAGVYTFYVSTDGGVTFAQKSTNQFSNLIGTEISGRSTVQGMRCRPYPMIAADNSFGPNRGRLYLVYASNNPSGGGNKSDIFLRYSTDQGATWSSAVVANDDPNSQNNFQFHPAIWCDKETGRLYIKFYDTRLVPTSDSMDVYATYTDDGGQTFAPNQRLTNRTFKINISGAAGPTYRGDYDAITSNRYASMAVWTDFRNAPSPNYTGMTAYFPDFAMLARSNRDTLNFIDSTTAVIRVPAVKLYTQGVKFTASVSPAAPFVLSFPNGDSLASVPDSLVLKIKTSGVAAGNYVVTVVGRGPNGTPAHMRALQIRVLASGNIVAVQQPNGGEVWLEGSSHDIRWAKGGSVTSVRVDYSTNNGGSWTLIDSNASGTSLNWTVPSTPTTEALVRVAWVDSLVTVFDQSDATFTISPPSSTVVLPANPGPTNNSGAANWAMFFNLIAGPQPVTITGMTTASAALANATYSVVVFKRSGNALGGPVGSGPGSSTVGWDSLGTVPVTQGPIDAGVSLPFDVPQIHINAGDTAGVAIRFLTVGPRYFGTGTPPYETYSDANLTLITGDSRSVPFNPTGSFFSSRALVGEIQYTTTTVDVKDPGREIPATFALLQNYPNPFNPSTTISYGLPMQATVQVKIFNMLGQEIATLVDGPQPGGSYSISWNGNSNAGHAASSGVYVYRLEAKTADGKTITSVKKMLLLR
jgi:hypothetical protein